jgi:hypothetical protein
MCDDIFSSKKEHEKNLEKNSESQDKDENLPGFQGITS